MAKKISNFSEIPSSNSKRVMKECLLYDSIKENGKANENMKGKVRCSACSHRCIISDGNMGICGVRKNVRGKLYSLVYGKALGLGVDPIEKKPFYHFYPSKGILSFGTVGCNFRCEFCQNYGMSQATREMPKNPEENIEDELHGIFGDDLLPEDIIKTALKNKVNMIAFTYNEPTIFVEYAIDTAKLAKEKGMKTVFVTNGYETPETLKLIRPYVDAMNIDLKSFSDEFYRKVCGARLQPVLDCIKMAWNMGFWVEVTTLVIPGRNDSKEELTSIAKFLASVDKNMPWHISRFFPMFKMQDVPMTSESKLSEAYTIGKNAGLNYVYVGNINIPGTENTSCPKCGQTLIERSNYIVKIGNFKNGVCGKCKTRIAGCF